jgi:hypothetical protein
MPRGRLIAERPSWFIYNQGAFLIDEATNCRLLWEEKSANIVPIQLDPTAPVTNLRHTVCEFPLAIRLLRHIHPRLRANLISQAKGHPMQKLIARSGKVGYIILWLLGIPIPVLLLIFALRGCN